MQGAVRKLRVNLVLAQKPRLRACTALYMSSGHAPTEPLYVRAHKKNLVHSSAQRQAIQIMTMRA